jgi:hypothetical protein
LLNNVHVGASYAPKPSPVKIVAGGPAAVSVTLNVAPAVATVNGWKSLPATLTVPVKLSVEAAVVGVGADGVAVAELSLLPPHADATTTAVRTRMMTAFIRSAQYEFLFWDGAYQQRGWPDFT